MIDILRRTRAANQYAVQVALDAKPASEEEEEEDSYILYEDVMADENGFGA